MAPHTPYDDVTNPKHYASGSIEPIDFLQSRGFDSFCGFCEGNILKYIVRWRRKSDDAATQIKDLEKAQFYIGKLIEAAKEEASGQLSFNSKIGGHD